MFEGLKMSKRYLLQVKKAKNGVLKQFVFGWTPILAVKKGITEIPAKTAEAIMAGETVQIDSLSESLLNDDQMISVHIKKEFLTQVFSFIETLEKENKSKIPATADFPEVTIQSEEKTIVVETEGSVNISVLKREINSIKSKNGLENYIEENKIAADISRSNSLYDMKQQVIKIMLERK